MPEVPAPVETGPALSQNGEDSAMISNEEYLEVQETIQIMAAMVIDLPLDAFIERLEHAETVAPLLHPEQYRRAAGKLKIILLHAHALRQFQMTVIKSGWQQD